MLLLKVAVAIAFAVGCCCRWFAVVAVVAVVVVVVVAVVAVVAFD